MSDSAPSKSLSSSAERESVELVAEDCTRWTCCNRLLLALLVVNLLISLTNLVVGLAHGNGSSATPEPTPSTTAPADPSPSSSATNELPRPTPSPTAPMPPDPTGTACNIFDPECSSGTGGAEA